MVLEQNLSRARDRRTGRAVAAALATVLAACGGGDGDTDGADGSTPLAGWRRTDIIGHLDVQSYDEVATASTPGRLSWLGRAPGDHALAHFQSTDGDFPEVVELAPPATSVGSTLTPTTVSTADDDAWVAVADIRARPGDLVVGLVAWRGPGVGSAAPLAGDALVPAAGTTIAFDRVGAGRVGDTAVVLALTGPSPPVDDGPTGGPVPEDIVAWTATGDGGWEPSQPDLGIDGPLDSLRVTGDGARLVLAAVTAGGDARLWSSEDGHAWALIDEDSLPSGTEGVDLLTPVASGEVAVGWRRDDAGHSTTVVQLLGANDAVADVGTVEPTPDSDIEGVVANGAAIDDEGELVLVGAGDVDADMASSSNTPVPLVWTQEDDSWIATQQTELVGRLDYRFRAVTTTSEGDLAGLITPYLRIEVELWEWEPPD